jgi:hypothetical protein
LTFEIVRACVSKVIEKLFTGGKAISATRLEVSGEEEEILNSKKRIIGVVLMLISGSYYAN